MESILVTSIIEGAISALNAFLLRLINDAQAKQQAHDLGAAEASEAQAEDANAAGTAIAQAGADAPKTVDDVSKRLQEGTA